MGMVDIHDVHGYPPFPLFRRHFLKLWSFSLRAIPASIRPQCTLNIAQETYGIGALWLSGYAWESREIIKKALISTLSQAYPESHDAPIPYVSWGILRVHWGLTDPGVVLSEVLQGLRKWRRKIRLVGIPSFHGKSVIL